MSLNGGNLSTRSSLTRNIETHGSVRAQNVSTQVIRGENCTMDTGTFTTTNTETLTVSNGITTPRITLTGAGGSVILATDASAYTGSDSVLIGSTSSAADNTIIIGTENTITAAGEFSVVIGHNNKDASTVDGDHNIILGQGDVNGRSYNVLAGFGNSVATGDFSVVLGRDASSSGGSNAVLGNGANVDDDDCVAIGTGAAVVGAPFGVSIGLSSSVTGENGVSIGADCTASGESSFVAGKNSTASGAESLAIGKDSSASTFGAVSMGRGSTSSGQYAIAIGSAASVSNVGVAVGKAAVTNSGVSVGPDSASASGVSIGNRVTSVQNGIAMGQEAYSISNSSAIGYKASTVISQSVTVGFESNCGGYVSSIIHSGTGDPVTVNNITQLVCTQYTDFSTPYVVTFSDATNYTVTLGGEVLGSGVAITPSAGSLTAPTLFGRSGRTEIRFNVLQPLNQTGTEVPFSGGDVISINVQKSGSPVPCVSIGSYVNASRGSVAIGNSVASDDYSTVVGTNIAGNFAGAVAIGSNILATPYGTTNTGYQSVMIGYNIQSGGAQSVVIGRFAYAVEDSVAIGAECESGGVKSVSLGWRAGNSPGVLSGASGNTAIGPLTLGGLTNGTYNATVGWAAGDSITTGSFNVVIGTTADVSAGNVEYAVAIGRTCIAHNYSVAVGYKCNSSSNQGLRAVAIGYKCNTGVTGAVNDTIAIGTSARVATAVTDAVAIGNGAIAGFNSSVSLGPSVSTRMADEFTVPGMRIVRATASGDLSSATTLIDFPMTTTDEIAGIDATITVHDQTGSNYIIFEFRRYLFANDGTTTLATVSGISDTRSTSATTDTCTLTAPATTETARLTFTASDANSRSVVAIMRIYAGGLS